MPFSINPDLIENNDVEIQTVDGELALFHKPSGNTLIVDEDTRVSEKLQSPLRDNVDLDGNDLISGGSGEFADLEAEKRKVEVEKSTFTEIDEITAEGSDRDAGRFVTMDIEIDEDPKAIIEDLTRSVIAFVHVRTSGDWALDTVKAGTADGNAVVVDDTDVRGTLDKERIYTVDDNSLLMSVNTGSAFVSAKGTRLDA